VTAREVEAASDEPILPGDGDGDLLLEVPLQSPEIHPVADRVFHGDEARRGELPFHVGESGKGLLVEADLDRLVFLGEEGESLAIETPLVPVGGSLDGAAELRAVADEPAATLAGCRGNHGCFHG